MKEENLLKITFATFLHLLRELGFGDSFEFACHYNERNNEHHNYWGAKKCNDFDTFYLILTRVGGGVLNAVDFTDRYEWDVENEIYSMLKDSIDIPKETEGKHPGYLYVDLDSLPKKLRDQIPVSVEDNKN